MGEILFLKPLLKETLWGGNRLASEFPYEISGENAGECWGIAAHEHGDCEVLSGTYKGKRLSELWAEHRELFGGLEGERFPLLVKIIDAAADLSIQVHPDDTYAREQEGGSLGKTECWYILDCDPDSEIVIGHHAKTREELRSMMEQGNWEDLIRVVPVHPGDFFQISPGCVHAIKRGILLIETQQNSDITYRMYDYDRVQNGAPRQLHVKQCGDVITVPHQPEEIIPETTEEPGCYRTRYVHCPFYTVERLEIKGEYVLRMPYPFMNVSVIGGNGTVDGIPIQKGDHFILPSGTGEVRMQGGLELIVSWC